MMLNSKNIATSKLVHQAIALILLVIVVILFVVAFEQIPIEGTTLGFDWISLWTGIKGGSLNYEAGSGVRNPPWSLLIILPLGLFSFRASWGLLTLLTLAVLVVSVPNSTTRKTWLLSAVLLTTSFPAMRHVADGNFEGLVIAGLLLILYGYHRQNPWGLAGGILLATAKIQEIWLLLIILGIYVFKTWPIRRWLFTSTLMALVIIPSLLWLGPEWWAAMTGMPQRETIVNASLAISLERLGWPGWSIYALWSVMLVVTLYTSFRDRWSISREKAGLLIAASLLLAPYSAGNSFLTVLAIGIIPLFQVRRRLGLALIGLTNLPYLVAPFLSTSDTLFWLMVYYWTAMLILVWGVLVWRLMAETANIPSPPPVAPFSSDFNKFSDSKN